MTQGPSGIQTADEPVNVVLRNVAEIQQRQQQRELGAALALQIFRLLKIVQFHAIDNMAVLQQLDQTVEALRGFGHQTGEPLTMLFAKGTVFVAGYLLKASRAEYESALELGEMVRKLGVSEVTIQTDATRADLTALARLFQGNARPRVENGILEPSPRIRLRYVNPARLGEDEEELTLEEQVVRTYATCVIVMRRVYDNLIAGRYQLPHQAKRLAQRLVMLSEGDNPAFLGITAMRNLNHDTAGRAVNRSILAVAMARQLTNDLGALARIAMSALFFDVAHPLVTGLVGRGNDVLVPRMTEDAERRLPAATGLVLTALGQLRSASIVRSVIAYEAHWLRQVDRLGAMYGGTRRAMVAPRIVVTANRFNELLEPDLAASRTLTPDEAVERMRAEAADATERAMLALLVGALGIFPRGTAVLLNTNERGVVVKTPGEPADYVRPTVRLVYDAHGQPLRSRPTIELADDPVRQIVEVIAPDPLLAEVAQRVIEQAQPAVSEAPPPSSRPDPLESHGAVPMVAPLDRDVIPTVRPNVAGSQQAEPIDLDAGELGVEPIELGADEAAQAIALAPEPVATEAEPLEPDPEPIALAPEPVEPEPVATEAEPLEPEPEPIATEAEPLEPEPIALAPESITTEAEPIAVAPEPIALAPESITTEAEPIAVAPEPIALAPEPKPDPSTADLVVERTVYAPPTAQQLAATMRPKRDPPVVKVDPAPPPASARSHALAPPTSGPMSRPRSRPEPLERPAPSRAPKSMAPPSMGPPRRASEQGLAVEPDDTPSRSGSLKRKPPGPPPPRKRPPPTAVAPPAKISPPEEISGPEAFEISEVEPSAPSSHWRRQPKTLPPQERPTGRGGFDQLHAPSASGSFERTPFSHILLYLLDRSLSGTLIFTEPADRPEDQPVEHAAFFQDGAPTKIHCGQRIAPLGALLVAYGFLDQRQLEGEPLTQPPTHEATLESELVEFGLARPEQIAEVRNEQLAERLIYMFGLPAGTKYSFYNGLDLLEAIWGNIPGVAAPLSILTRGIRRYPEESAMDRVLTRLGGYALRLHPEADVDAFELDPDERAVADSIAKTMAPLPDLVEAGHDPDVIRRVVYLLMITRCIAPVLPKGVETSAVRVTGSPNSSGGRGNRSHRS